MTTSTVTPRVTSFAPQFLVDDLQRSLAYYEKMGFRFGEPWDGFYAIGLLDGLEIHLKEARQNQAEREWRRSNEHLDAAGGVDGVEAFYERCVANGISIIKPLADTAWGTKDFYIEDPDGYIISFGGGPTAGHQAPAADVVRTEGVQLDDFAALVREYRQLVDHAEPRGAHAFLRDCARLLPRIYSAGIDLPNFEPEEEGGERSVRASVAKLRSLLGEYDSYWEIFDPYEDEPPVCGSLSDDLSDIYQDLVRPLMEFEEGRVRTAVWDWKFNINGHAGDHLVDAMRAIHRLIQGRVPGPS